MEMSEIDTLRRPRRHRPPRHAPRQPGRDARRCGRSAARATARDGAALGRRLPLGRRRAVLSLYVVCAFGTTIGFHRYFTHRGFTPTRPSRQRSAMLGCMTMQGPITQWVTDHRKHHALSDKPGDPHSPHVGHGEGASGRREGLRPRARWLALHEPRAWSKVASTARISTRTGWSAGSTGSTSSGSSLSFGIPFAIGYCDRRRLARRGRGARLGRAAPHLRLPARDLQRELDLPHVRAAGLPLARRGTEQLGRRGCSSSARAGTTTTTRSRRPHDTASCAGSSTRPGG